MFDGAGLTIKSIEHVINPPLDMDKINESGNKFLKDNLEITNLTKRELVDLFTYQFIVIAQKTTSPEKKIPSGSTNNIVTSTADLLPQSQQDSSISNLTSVVILTFNELEYTKKCVKSIRKHTPEDHEIIFVDNGSTDGTLKWLKSQVQENKNYKLIENKKNLGFAKGCNQGIKASRGEFILLLNNDVVVEENWLSDLLECLNFAPDAGIIGPMTNNISGRQQIADEDYRSVDFLDKYAARFREMYRHRRIPLRRVVGFCMLFKRTLTEQIGMLDESFGTGNFEDDDFCLRATLEGYKNYIAGDVFIHHFGSRSFIGNKIDHGAAMSGNRKIIDKKWTLSTQSEMGKKSALLRATVLADESYQQGKIDQAIETLVNCIKLTPEAKEIYYTLIRMFIETKRFSEAWEVMETMSEEAKNELKTLEYAGYIKEGLGQDDEASVYADRILSQNENCSAALNLQGILAYKKGDKEKAQAYFKRAIEADPGYGEACTNLGVLYWGLDKKNEALVHLQRGFILSPEIPDVSSIYYSVVSSLGLFIDAEAAFREAARLYPNCKNIIFLYIDTLIQQGKFNEAMLKIEDALNLFGPDEGTLNAALAVREKIGPLSIDKNKKNTLSLCMIVKNEEKHLVKCLKSVRDVVDEMIVVDTGSADKTKDIAKVFGAKIFDFPWTGDFSQARNYSLKQATGDWIFILDADEVISPRDFKELNALINKGAAKPAAYTIVTRNYFDNTNQFGWTANKGEYPEEVGTGWIPSPKVRLFPRKECIYFSYPVHETLEASITKANIPVKPCNIIVHHYGKMAGKTNNKGESYYLLGRMKLENDPTNCNHIQELARQALALERHEECIELSLKLLSIIKTDPKAKASINYMHPMKLDPEAEIYIHLTSSYLALDRYEEALSTARSAMTINPNIKEVMQNYANCEIITGSVDKADTVLHDLLIIEPDYPPALLLLVVVFCLKGQVEMMQNLFQALLNKGFNITPGLNSIARGIFLAQKKISDAQLILQTMIENRLGDVETTNLLATLQNQKDE